MLAVQNRRNNKKIYKYTESVVNRDRYTSNQIT